MSGPTDLKQMLENVLQSYPDLTGKRMFGGVAYMLNGNMCCGISKNNLILRLSLLQASDYINAGIAQPFMPTGRPMKGWVTIVEENLESEGELSHYLEQAINFVKTLPAK